MTDQTQDEVLHAAKFAKLGEWTRAVEAANVVKPVIEKEQALRKEVMTLFFPDPKEGTNSAELGEGYVLKGTHKLDRKLDEAALPVVKDKLREMGVNPDPLVDYKPSLNTAAYKSLVIVNAEAARVFELALTVKPGSPTLTISAPKVKE